MIAPAWQRLQSGLIATYPPAAVTAPVGPRLGAVLALVVAVDAAVDFDLVFIRRGDAMVHHPGQIAFPGGRVEQDETIEQAAVREATEEVGLRPDTAELLGKLPAFFVPPSGFWIQVVCAAWHAPHSLRAQTGEVAEILRIPGTLLTDPRVVRAMQLPTGVWSWAWVIDGDHLLWGATAVMTGLVLDLLLPGWAPRLSPADLPADRHLDPPTSAVQIVR